MRITKHISLLLGLLLLMLGSAAYAALPPRISWTPAQLTPASMAPGTSTTHTVVLKHTGILPIPFTNQLRIVAEGAIAPFVTIAQPKFPALFKRGNQVTFQVTITHLVIHNFANTVTYCPFCVRGGKQKWDGRRMNCRALTLEIND